LYLSIVNDPLRETSQQLFERFSSERVLERLRNVTAESDDDLVKLGMELDANGRVTKNSLGVFSLAWQAAEHPEWPQTIADEIAALKQRIQDTHGVPLRFVIWAGMGGSIEDKSMYNAAGLLKGGPRLYALDSTDPAKLKAIFEEMQGVTGQQLSDLLRSTLVIGMAMGMTSYEPVLNLERIASVYDKFGIDGKSNFLYMALPGSILEQFAAPRGFTHVQLQVDGGNSTAGRHSAPLTRGSLYPLALANVDLKTWIAGTALTDEEIATAWKLAAFLHAQGMEGRDKVALLLPRSWAGAGIWTKQDFEESLGKSEALGIKIVIGEKVRLHSYRRADDPLQDRAFLAIQRKGEPQPEAKQITELRHAKYPMAMLTFAAAAPLSQYMQFMHYAVGGLAYLRRMNFVTQPGVELYKEVASGLFADANKAGGTAHIPAWTALKRPDARKLGSDLKKLAASRAVEYGELTFFGDMRYNEEGRALRVSLERAADRIFRSRLKMPCDIYEGPAMNHSYHEMIIGHGKCFSILTIWARQTHFALGHCEPDYHMAQFLATKMALEKRGRHVVAFPIDDMEDLDRYFLEVASFL
jgi:glucose-6-phosphate isomerase